MKQLLSNKPLIVSLVVAFLIFGGLIIAWLSALYALEHMSFKEVTVAQLASAMRKDEFWSSNRFNTLIFDGKVQSIRTDNGKITLTFVSTDTYGAGCEISNSSAKFRVGETYKFAAETYQAERQPHGVLVHNCISQ